MVLEVRLFLFMLLEVGLFLFMVLEAVRLKCSKRFFKYAVASCRKSFAEVDSANSNVRDADFHVK